MKKINHQLILDMLAKHCLMPLVTTSRNGASHVVGSSEQLAALQKDFIIRAGYCPTIETEYTVDGVPQPGYPRMVFHPSVMDR